MSTHKKIRTHIRWMIRRDMVEVLAIENATSSHPWTDEDFLTLLRKRTMIGMVAELGEKIVGFMIYSLHKQRLEILNFAVDPEFQRQTVGQQMAAKLIGKLSSFQRTHIESHLRESNLDAQLFFRSQGFQAIKVEREHFIDTGEDGYLMRYDFEKSITDVTKGLVWQIGKLNRSQGEDRAC